MYKDTIGIILKGVCVGGTMLVPGVSGGSMAMILGIYDRLVSAVSSFWKHKKSSLLFLGLFSLSGIAGMLLFAKPLLGLIERYPMPMLYFFIGAVAGGIPMIYQQARVRRFGFTTLLYPLLGLGMVLLLSVLPKDLVTYQANGGVNSVLFLLVAGIIAAAALVLPGISVSYLLLVLGMYDEMIRAISTFYLPFLIPLGIGLVLGILLTTKMLEKAMKKYPRPTYLLILGFIVGSVAQVFPGIPVAGEWVTCIIAVLLGFGAIRLLSLGERS